MGTEVRSFAALAGTVDSISQARGELRFMLRNEDGVFSIHVARNLAQTNGQVVQPAAEVCVVGRPKTYYDRRLRTLQVIIWAETVTGIEENGSGNGLKLSPLLLSLIRLVTDYLTQALLTARLMKKQEVLA